MVEDRIDNALTLTNALFYSLAPLYQQDGGEVQRATVPLFTLLHSTSTNILNMVSQEMALHDADVLLRTLMEGTVRFCYLLNGTAEDRQKKYEEYRFALYDFERLSDHKKALETLEIFDEFSIQHSKVPFEVSVLPDEILTEIESKYTKKQKGEIKGKWTYQALLRDLAKHNEQYKAQLGTLSTYALTSHYAHFDWTGLSSRLAQLQSVAKGEDVHYDIVHCLRIISNILSFAMFRALEYIQAYGVKTQQTFQVVDGILAETNEIDSLANKLLSSISEG